MDFSSKLYAICGDKANAAAHTGQNNDGKCDVCEYQVGVSAEPIAPEDNDTRWVWMVMAPLGVIGVGAAAVVIYRKKRSFKK